MKTAHSSFRWLVAAAAVAQPLACAGDDSTSDDASSGNELAQTSGSPTAVEPEEAPAQGPALPTPTTAQAPASPATAQPALPTPATAVASAEPPSVVASLHDAGANLGDSGADAGLDSDYQNEEPDPYPGCMRG